MTVLACCTNMCGMKSHDHIDIDVTWPNYICLGYANMINLDLSLTSVD